MSGAVAEAGRELDALIAERLMGWTASLVEADDGSWWERRLYLIHNGAVAPHTGIVYPNDGAVRVGHGVPHYSTDIAAAWPVFERLTTPQIYRHVDGRFTVAWGSTRHSIDGRRVTAEAAPLAICLAALKTCEAP